MREKHCLMVFHVDPQRIILLGAKPLIGGKDYNWGMRQ